MPRYQHRVNRVIVNLPDGHAVPRGSEWERLDVQPAPAARNPDEDAPRATAKAPAKAKPARAK